MYPVTVLAQPHTSGLGAERARSMVVLVGAPDERHTRAKSSRRRGRAAFVSLAVDAVGSGSVEERADAQARVAAVILFQSCPVRSYIFSSACAFASSVLGATRAQKPWPPVARGAPSVGPRARALPGPQRRRARRTRAPSRAGRPWPARAGAPSKRQARSRGPGRTAARRPRAARTRARHEPRRRGRELRADAPVSQSKRGCPPRARRWRGPRCRCPRRVDEAARLSARGGRDARARTSRVGPAQLRRRARAGRPRPARARRAHLATVVDVAHREGVVARALSERGDRRGGRAHCVKRDAAVGQVERVGEAEVQMRVDLRVREEEGGRKACNKRPARAKSPSNQTHAHARREAAVAPEGEARHARTRRWRWA